ncbi:MAG: hypothetical protein AB8G05_14095 [Oligoflexales bacterium]
MYYKAAALLISLLMLSCKSTKDISFKKKQILKKNSDMRNRLITISSGRIGCPPEVIQIKDYYELNSFHEAWTAICFKRIFYCSYNNVSPACSERINSPEKASNPRGTSKTKVPLSPLAPPTPKASPIIRKAPESPAPRPELPETQPRIRINDK